MNNTPESLESNINLLKKTFLVTNSLFVIKGFIFIFLLKKGVVQVTLCVAGVNPMNEFVDEYHFNIEN